MQKLGAKRTYDYRPLRGGAAVSATKPTLTPRCSAKLLPILPHDRRSRFEPNADPASVVDIGAFGGDAPDDVLGGQYQCHLAATLTGQPFRR